MEEYNQIIAKRNKTRYVSIILFCLSVLFAVLFAFVSPFGDTSTLIIIMIWFLACFISFFYILIKPYFDQISPEQHEIDRLKPTQVKYYEELKFRLLYYIIIPILVIILLTIPFIIPTGIWPTVITVLTAMFFVVILFLFDRLQIQLDGQNLSVHLGPLKDKFAVSEITKVESIPIRPLKEYLGYGKRLGPDGSIGYIVKGGKAIRLVMNDSKIYVISSNDPDKLVSILKSGK